MHSAKHPLVSVRNNRKQCSALTPQAKASSTVQVDKEEIREEPPAKLEVHQNGSKGSQDLEVDAVLAKELNENGQPMSRFLTDNVLLNGLRTIRAALIAQVETSYELAEQADS